MKKNWVYLYGRSLSMVIMCLKQLPTSTEHGGEGFTSDWTVQRGSWKSPEIKKNEEDDHALLTMNI